MERRTKLQKIKRKRKHGFRVHMKNHGGRKVLQKRRLKKRKKLAV